MWDVEHGVFFFQRCSESLTRFELPSGSFRGEWHVLSDGLVWVVFEASHVDALFS